MDLGVICSSHVIILSVRLCVFEQNTHSKIFRCLNSKLFKYFEKTLIFSTTAEALTMFYIYCKTTSQRYLFFKRYNFILPYSRFLGANFLPYAQNFPRVSMIFYSNSLSLVLTIAFIPRHRHRPNNWKGRDLKIRALNLFLILITPTRSHQDCRSIVTGLFSNHF